MDVIDDLYGRRVRPRTPWLGRELGCGCSRGLQPEVRRIAEEGGFACTENECVYYYLSESLSEC